MEQLILTVVGVLLTTLCGSLLSKMKKIENDLEDKIDKKDVRIYIEDKLAVYDVRVDEMKEDIRDIKDDINAIKHKLDRLIERD